MLMREEQLKKYTCKLEKKFIDAFLQEYKDDYLIGEQMYDSNDMLEYLYNYPEVNDKSKQYYYFMCMKTFNDVPVILQRRYLKKFALIGCGNEIYNSYACLYSNNLLDCNGVKHSFGCSKCKFSDHLLYCTGQRHTSYMAFNKPISKFRFNELIKMSPEDLQKTEEFNLSIYSTVNSMMEYVYRLKEVT